MRHHHIKTCLVLAVCTAWARAELLTDPNDPRVWQGATIGTFAQLLLGADTPENRQQIIDLKLLDDGYFDLADSTPATLLPNAWSTSPGVGGCIGASEDLTGTGSLGYACGATDLFTAANGVDNLWFQTSGQIGDTVFDLGGPATKAAVFNTIDHGPLPGEAIESSVYLSNDLETWTPAVVERVWLEGFQPNTGILWDGFAFAVGTGTDDVFRYVSVIHGGPAAIVDDGDDELNGVVGLTERFDPICPNLTIDFETIDGQEPVDGQAISDQFLREYGVRFALETGGVPVLAEVGEPQTAFAGPGGAADTPAPGADAGRFFLTDDGQVVSAPLPVIISFARPVAGVSGTILDIDAEEAFTIEAVDAAGTVLGSMELGPNGVDGAASTWALSFEDQVIDRIVVRFSGTFTEGVGVGWALDNLSFDCPERVCPGTGSCCRRHASPGCEDESCCSLVCDTDPACCTGLAWDEICVGLADTLCVVDGETGACGCPLKKLFGADRTGALSTFYYLRDDVLARTESGSAYVDLYYRYGGQIGRMLILDRTLRDEVIEGLWDLADRIDRRSLGEHVVVTRKDVMRADRALRRMQTHADAELAGVLEQLRDDLRKGKLAKALGFGDGHDRQPGK